MLAVTRTVMVCEDRCGAIIMATPVWDGSDFAVECADCPAKMHTCPDFTEDGSCIHSEHMTIAGM